jgi:hypothetical protein
LTDLSETYPIFPLNNSTFRKIVYLVLLTLCEACM